MELIEHEQKLYDELFKMCDLHKTAKIPKIVVGELFSSSGLPTDISLQIADLCGASRLGYFGRSQFYIALKYIAAAQQQLPLNHEQVLSNCQLPIINRVALGSQLSNHSYDYATYIALLEPQTTPSLPPPVQMISATGVLPPPPTKKHVRNVSGTIQPGPIQSSLVPQSHLPQLNNSHPVLPLSMAGQAVTTAAVTAANTPNNSQVSDQGQSITSQVDTTDGAVGWASFPSPTKSHSGPVSAASAAHVARSPSPSKVVSPGEEPAAAADWNLCGVSKKSFNLDSCSLSSADYATSEASESMDDIWVINDEQREYYVNQFQSMQKELTATIKGPIAKGFFEKSKLPTSELSVIWKLSDVNKDGALTLQEFCTAMHLVVLRRNDVELPTILPPSLMPYTPASREPFASDLGEQLSRRSPSPPAPVIQSQRATGWSGPGASDTTSSWPAPENLSGQWTERQYSNNEQWNAAAAGESQPWQQTGDSSVHWRSEASESNSPLQAQWTGSSHSPTISINLVNFDSTIAIGDPEIAHPVPVKVSPSSQNALIDGTVRPRTDTDVGYSSCSGPLPASRDRSSTEGSITHPLQPLPMRPRPTPKKAQSIGGANTVDSNLKYPPPPQSLHGYQSLPGTTFPPTVPPRNRWSISSPDQEIRVGGEGFHPQTIDPFSAGGDVSVENFADFSTKFGEPSNEPFGASISDNHTSNDVLPAHTMPTQSVLLPATTAPILRPQISAHQFSIRDKREIQLSIKIQRERNEILVRSSSELHSELQEVVEQRISLEIQLEHIKPC